jgi:20S proteasome alpha/beta subunit
MTIVVAVKVNDGLVLAADSALAIQGVVDGQQAGILKTYDYGRKLSHC